jgi:enoyl-CoA hydratase/carnithine racemase
VFDAREARDKGLVHRVVADGALDAEVQATAGRIAAGAPLVARWHKRFIHRLSADVILTESQWNEGYACFDTEDYREGLAAFLAKREPQFRGK